ncbi:MAG: CopG family ribbon-helix-helix protein [Alphaproteobacteria bacterium]|nr:CopG family ribbon-helix-helix protein [Alphaproteobacteria bacterium]
MSATVPVTVRVSVEVNEKLEQLAKATRRSKSWLASEAIGGFVKSESDYLAAVDEGRQAARAGRTIPHEEMRAWLLSWGTDHELPPPKVG